MPGSTSTSVTKAGDLNRTAYLCTNGQANLMWAMARGTGSCEWSPYSTGVEWSPVMQIVKGPLPSVSACHSCFTSCPTIASTTSRYPTCAKKKTPSKGVSHS